MQNCRVALGELADMVEIILFGTLYFLWGFDHTVSICKMCVKVANDEAETTPSGSLTGHARLRKQWSPTSWTLSSQVMSSDFTGITWNPRCSLHYRDNHHQWRQKRGTSQQCQSHMTIFFYLCGMVYHEYTPQCQNITIVMLCDANNTTCRQ